jgi:hypothetical protein
MMGVLDFLPVIGTAVQKLLDLIPDPGARARAAEEYQKTVLEITAKAESEQREINRAEAASASLFVAGWRPAIGWVCALALGFQYLARPLLDWAAARIWPGTPPLPGLDDGLWQLMFGMLGMGSLRSFEKTRGVAK